MTNIEQAQAAKRTAAMERPQRIDGEYFPTRYAAIEHLVAEGYRVEDHKRGPRLVKGRSFYIQEDLTKTAIDYAREITAEEGYAQYYGVER